MEAECDDVDNVNDLHGRSIFRKWRLFGKDEDDLENKRSNLSTCLSKKKARMRGEMEINRTSSIITLKM